MAGMNRSLLPLATALLHATTAAPASEAGTLPALPRTAMSVDHPATGFHAGTGNEHESRPALSLIKLYLADYVLSHGDPADAEKARHMVRTSDDATASELQARYPGAIRHTADYYGLRATTEAPTGATRRRRRRTSPPSCWPSSGRTRRIPCSSR